MKLLEIRFVFTLIVPRLRSSKEHSVSKLRLVLVVGTLLSRSFSKRSQTGQLWRLTLWRLTGMTGLTPTSSTWHVSLNLYDCPHIQYFNIIELPFLVRFWLHMLVITVDYTGEWFICT